MLCHNQRCSYSHWRLHTSNYIVNKTISGPDSKKYFKNKKKLIKILNEFQHKPPSTSAIDKENKEVQNSSNSKYSSQESIFVPKDPTSPYAFTLNVNIQRKKRKYWYNQVALEYLEL